jgi:hypothetical protein
MSKTSEPVLCYVRGSCAWFTTAPIKTSPGSTHRQWGDDWDDAPYEHNAGEPYEYHPVQKAAEPYSLTRVYFEGDFLQPHEYWTNSPYSVISINEGAVAWLRPASTSEGGVYIQAGTPLSEFKRLVRKAGGSIFVEETPSDDVEATR